MALYGQPLTRYTCTCVMNDLCIVTSIYIVHVHVHVHVCACECVLV